ncbi:VOC family protein [Dactylosporangium sp. NPDC005572]|uniref:VOC family protein n=1 Tax=Dactylosporangium sp. NPDC005572 TaxID=3156889 RepID=UPI0033A45D35
MTLVKFFHLIHLVDDLDRADAWYDAVFSPHRFYRAWDPRERRDASLQLIGDFIMEPIMASKAAEDQQMPLSRFYQRFGEHYHSLAWYVEEETCDDLCHRLRHAGVRIAKPGGGTFAEGESTDGLFFTHPKDTYGQIEIAALNSTFRGLDPRFVEGWSGGFWRDEHPLHLLGPSHITVAVRDLSTARRFYEQQLGGTTLHEESTPTTKSAFVLVGSDIVIELAEPTSPDSRIGQDLAHNGEMPYAVTFRVRDLEAAERHVTQAGAAVADRAGQTLTLDPADTFNVVFAFTERTIPGDPR